MDASNILKPALASGKMRCIGATTYHEYRSYFERDRALARRFQKIEVHEPSIEDAVEILNGLKPHYEEHHGVEYTRDALKAAAELSAKYINDRFLPDKAIDVIDEVGASFQIRPAPEEDGKKIIHDTDIESIVAKIARIPPRSVSASDKERLQSLDADLKGVVFGQDTAIETLVRAIRLARAGLGQPEKPVGSFLFSGPTGVGKTELARTLAEFLFADREALIRVDMSEYMERFSVSRLIGAPPGYVGYDDSGTLTKAVRRRPYSVVLLDEIEKAHPDVFNILLQVLDEGHLTDNYGRVIDFKNTVLIMTSNLGARDIARGGLGFQRADARSGYENMRDKVNEEINRTFNPEFLNRVDDTIVFHPLSRDEIGKIVHIMLGDLQERLAQGEMSLSLTPRAIEFLVEHGYNAKYGARPLKRAIRRFLEEPLSEKLLMAEFGSGDEIEADVSEDGETLALAAASPSKT